MNTLKLDKLNNLCRSSGILLDWVAREIVAISFEPKKENMKLITDSMSNLFDVNEKIWKLQPELTPYHLKEQDENKERIVYGPDNPMPDWLREKLKIRGAIELLKGLSESDNTYIKEIADKHIPILEEKLNET